MDLIDAASGRDAFANSIPELAWSTGPISYEYHFRERGLFDAVVTGSWMLDGSLFGADATTLLVDGATVAGVLIAMPGPEFQERRHGLAPVWQRLVGDGDVEWSAVQGVIERSDRASWLNPALHEDTYYVHALAVAPEFRGQGLGYRLIQHAIGYAVDNGFARLQLDVLSDNPAVAFYESIGLEVLAETRAPDPSAFGVPPEYRMGMRLTER